MTIVGPRLGRMYAVLINKAYCCRFWPRPNITKLQTRQLDM